jgi:hypothetical protein
MDFDRLKGLPTAEQVEKRVAMFQKQRGKFFGSLGDRKPCGMSRVGAARPVIE